MKEHMKKKASNALLKLERGRKLTDWLVRGFNITLLGQVTITQPIKDAMLGQDRVLEVPLDGDGETNQLHSILTGAHKDACRGGGLACYYLNPIEKEKNIRLLGVEAAGAGPDDPLTYRLQANWGSFFDKCNLELLSVISLYARLFEGQPYFLIRFDGCLQSEGDELPPTTNMAADAVVEGPVPTSQKLAACVPNLFGGCVPGLVGGCIPCLLGLCAHAVA